ncbi:DEAD/DEAH box helicase family protein [Rickettsia endosymbiont of Ixodes pacificus]|uniref:DEAD/DEAH box helicase family protein n=1 Tax=Rickettsia endosymbiont of Ixodes pacificus TaxID=1133329 RepID=UPI0018CE1C55|nr:DEAD/DEAH box helicase family protein [Rickettsia endosymbiont of Ixodes pacificus]
MLTHHGAHGKLKLFHLEDGGFNHQRDYKFNRAFENDFRDSSNNIFVFIDECHRTQYGDLASKMRAILPNACYIGFTGTPLFKEYKNTIKKFGESIHKYTMKDALKDNIIVPLFYEGRIVQQHINDESSLNKKFDTITNELDEEKKQL